MLKRSFVGISVLVLGGCLDIFGADRSGDDDSDGGESGIGGVNRGGTGGRARGGRAGMPSGGTSAGESAGGTVTAGASSGGATAGNPNTGGDAPVGGMGGIGVGGVIGVAGQAGAGSGGASSGGAGTGNGGGAGKAGSAGTGGSGGGTCATEELLLNGNFDYGDTDWEFTSYNWASLVVNNAGVAPQSGTFLGRLGGYEVAEDFLYQVIDIPPSATNIVLSFYEQITTTWTYDYPYDLLGVGVFDAVTGDSFGDFTLSNTDAHTGWIRHQVTIDPSAAGAYAIVAGVAYGYDYEYSTLFIDTLSLQARVCR